ncbi:MAG TPA: hypothetical protein VIO94_07840 [Phenylobacterium sp.]
MLEEAKLAAQRDAVLAALQAWAERTPEVTGLWLQGSLSVGDADALSDIDAYLAIEDSAFEATFAAREAIIEGVRPILAWSDATFPGLKCVHALLDGGVRLDLCFEPLSKVGGTPRPTARMLVDKGALRPEIRLGWTAPVDALGRILLTTIRMTRQGGTWPLRVIMRGQWATFAMMELNLINTQVAQLMALQIDPALYYQNPFSLPRRLTPAQRERLEALTDEVLAAVQDRSPSAALAAHLQVFDVLVSEGRAACEALGVAYPIREDQDARLRRLLVEAWPVG